MLYFFYPDREVVIYGSWADVPDGYPPESTILYEPGDSLEWCYYHNRFGSVLPLKEIPTWCKAYALLI